MNYSVIIPAYNCEQSITKTVVSICDTQIEYMEIIIVDDGSTHNTYGKCNDLVKRYPFVRYYFQENQGVSSARNYGVSKALGKYIVFLDSDDQVDSKKLGKCMRIAAEQDVDLLIFGMTFYRLYNDMIFQVDHLNCENEERINKNEIGKRMVELFEINYLQPVWNKIFKREIAKKVFFNTYKMCFEDFLYSMEFLQYCDSVYLMPDLAYIYMMENSSRKPIREKRINDFNEYFLEFQTAVLNLEKHFGSELTEFRLRIGLIYEWMLRNKLQSSNYANLKKLDKDKMKLVLFDEEYVSQTKIIRLFFENKLISLRLYCAYRNIRHRISLRMRCIKYKLANQHK